MFAVLRTLTVLGLLFTVPALVHAQERKVVDYTCAEKQSVSVAYTGPNKASVTYLGSTYKMKRDRSADGARFVSKGMQWWTKGNGGFLAGASATHLIARDCIAKK